jgi:Na+-translocating ferredoxin:NAD+ oxidoreductase RnfC subunit
MKKETFPHGIHPPEHKSPTEDKTIEIMPPPEKISIPLLQHFGSPAKPLVKKGEEVLLGQKIAHLSFQQMSIPVFPEKSYPWTASITHWENLCLL